MTRWHGPRGIEVEVILRDTGPMIRIRQTVNGRKYLVGYCATIAQVTQHVDLADLVEVIDFPDRQAAP